MTGEEQRKKSEKISAPPEIIQPIIRDAAGAPEQMERVRVIYE